MGGRDSAAGIERRETKDLISRNTEEKTTEGGRLLVDRKGTANLRQASDKSQLSPHRLHCSSLACFAVRPRRGPATRDTFKLNSKPSLRD